MELETKGKVEDKTTERFEIVRRKARTGEEFWMARELGPELGYPVWGNFEPVLKRAVTAMKRTGVDPSQHIVQTKKVVTARNNSTVESRDYFLSRAACYLIAMNGDPAKPQIAAAQAYFTIQTRRMELSEAAAEPPADGVKRLRARDKVSASLRRVSTIADQAGVKRKAVFHGERIKGFYCMGQAQLHEKKGLAMTDELLDHIGELELSAHEFQMKLAAASIENENIQGESAVLRKNFQVGEEVRKAWCNSVATLPEDLPKEEHISKVRKRLTGKREKAVVNPSDPTASGQLSLLSQPSVQGSGF